MAIIGLNHAGWSWSRDSQPSMESEDGACSWNCVNGSDYWRLTESGGIAHNGHACLFPADGDFSIEGHFSAPLEARYDQLGLIVLKNETHWFKGGFELDGRIYVGGVHTRGTSDWAFAPASLPGGLKLSRQANTLEMFWRSSAGEWARIRQLTLEGPVQAGFYSAAPLGPGMRSRVSGLRLDVTE